MAHLIILTTIIMLELCCFLSYIAHQLITYKFSIMLMFIQSVVDNIPTMPLGTTATAHQVDVTDAAPVPLMEDLPNRREEEWVSKCVVFLSNSRWLNHPVESFARTTPPPAKPCQSTTLLPLSPR